MNTDNNTTQTCCDKALEEFGVFLTKTLIALAAVCILIGAVVCAVRG